MSKITKERLFSADPVAYRGTLPNGDEVTLRKATQADLDYVFGNGDDDGAEVKGLYARLVIAGLANDDGTPMFSRNEYAEVANIPLPDIQPIANAIQEHCGFNALEEDAIEGKS